MTLAMRLLMLGELKLEGSPLTRPKPLLLLAYLSLEGSRDRRDLAELFFRGNQDRAQGLRVALSHLNKEAGGALRSSEKRLWTELPSDVAELEQLSAAGQWEKALELYRGPFLEGLNLSDLGEELEEWLYTWREKVAVQVREVKLKLAEQKASQGDFVGASHLAEKAYLLRYAPEPEIEMLERFYTLLRAGEASTDSVVKEAKGYDLELSLSLEEAKKKLQSTSLQTQPLAANPYVGLFAFQEEHAPFFFGRERAASDIVQRCQSSPHVVTVIGNSGAGKSSLVFAGVLPQLREDNWLISTLRPGRQPFEALALALSDLLLTDAPQTASEQEQLLESQELARHLRERKLELSAVVSRMLSLKTLSKQPQQRLLVVVDQLEELFTITEGQDDAATFLEVLLGAARKLPGQFSLIVTLRADFIGALLEYPPILLMLQETRYFLGAMTRDELRQAMMEPAQKQGVSFEAGLVQRILDDVAGQEGSLPLLEFALSQLWEKQENATLTHHAYDTIGGVEEALANHADATFHKLTEAEQRLAKKVFLQLVYPGVGQEDTRRIATRDELEDAWPLVQKLASYPARLLVTGYSEIGEQTAEVSHEALIRRWGMLRNWMSDYRSFRTWQERLRQDVKLWGEEQQTEATLLRGYRLDEAKVRMTQYSDLLTSGERNFIGQSLALREQETTEREKQRQEQLESLEKLAREESSRRKAEQARVRLRSNALWLIGVLGCVAIGLATVSYIARNQAVTARNEATALLPKLLSSVALNSKEVLPQRSLLLALEADRIATQNNDPNQSEVQRVLRQLVSETGGLPLPHPEPVRTTAISPDGQWPNGPWFVTGSDDGKIRFWDQKQLTAQPPDKTPLVLEAHGDILNSIRFSPDGSWLASGGWDKVIQVWDTRTLPDMPRLITSLEGFEKTVSDINVSADGKYLGAIGLDNTVRLWTTSSWEPYKTLGLPGTTAWGVSFSPDGRYIAASIGYEREGAILLWSMADLEAPPIELRLEAPAWAVTFSPDNRWLAAGNTNGSLSLWQLDDVAQRPLLLQEHSDNIIDVAFSPNMQWLVTASEDKTLRLHFISDIAKHYPTRNAEAVRAITLLGHEDAVTNLAFSRDERWLLSGSRDHATRLWDMRFPSADLMVLAAHGDGERRTELSPDGTLLASGNLDGTVYLQNLSTIFEPSVALGKHDSWVEALAFSPDGNILVSASDAINGGEKTLELWHTAEQPVRSNFFPMNEDSKTIFDVAFSTDGNLLATAGEDKTAQLWNIHDLSQPLAIFLGHEDIVTDVALSPDSKLLASASFDTCIRIWKVENPDAPFKILEGHRNGVRTVAFSPDGELLASGGQDSVIKIWSTQTWQVITTLNAGSRTWALAFSPDSQALATANEDGTLGLWERNSETLELLQGHTNTTWSVSFSQDGKWIVSASEDGTVRFWPASIAEVRTLACQKAGRNLSKAEWQDMFGTFDYQATCPQFSEVY